VQRHTISLDELQLSGDAALRSSNFDDARRIALHVLGRYRASLWATRTLGFALANQGRGTEAFGQFRLVTSVDPLDAAAYQSMVTLAEQSSLDHELPQLRMLLEDHWSAAIGPLSAYPGTISISRLAVLQERSRMWPQAVDSLRRAVKMDDSRPDLYLLLARSLYMLRAFEEAESVVNALLLGAQDCLEANVIAAALARREGDAKLAEQALARAYACDPSGAIMSRLLPTSGLFGVTLRRNVEIMPPGQGDEAESGTLSGVAASYIPYVAPPAEFSAVPTTGVRSELPVAPHSHADSDEMDSDEEASAPETESMDTPLRSGDAVGLGAHSAPHTGGDWEPDAADVTEDEEQSLSLNVDNDVVFDATLGATATPSSTIFPDFEEWFQANVLDAVESMPQLGTGPMSPSAAVVAESPSIEQEESVVAGLTVSSQDVEDDISEGSDPGAPLANQSSEDEPAESPDVVVPEGDGVRRWTFPHLDPRKPHEPIRSKLADLAENVGRQPLNNGSRFELATELEREDPTQAVAQYAIIVASHDPRLVADVRQRLESLLSCGERVPGLQRLLGDVCMQQGSFERAIECYSLAYDELRSRQLTDRINKS
jgi:hypothetical protein